MSGKALLFLVIGFTVIFLVMYRFWGDLAARSVDNYFSYYKNTVARNIAVSGANIGLSEFKRDSTSIVNISDRDFESGKMDVNISSPAPQTVILTSTGTFMGAEKKVKVKLMRNKKVFTDHAWSIPHVSTANIPWITGDTVWGSFHSNQFLVVNGNPVFTGKVTTLKKIIDMASPPNVSNPQFLGGYEEGAKMEWSTDMSFPVQASAANEGISMGGTCSFNLNDLWLTFNENGTITYRTAPKDSGPDSSKYSLPVTLPISVMAPTGIIYLSKGNVYISGTLSGKITVVSEGSSGGIGNIYLLGDIVYTTDPMIPNGAGGYMTNPDCNDMMGLMASNNIYVSTTGNLGSYENNIVDSDIHVDAGIFCVKGGFEVEKLGQSPANFPMGSIYLQGSMTAGHEEKVALYNGSVLTAGYNRHVIYDSRFSVAPPLYFPGSHNYKVISWLE